MPHIIYLGINAAHIGRSSEKLSQEKVNRIVGTVVNTRPLKWQASLRGHNLVQKYEVVAVGHRFGKVSVLATMWCNFYPKNLD